MTSNIESTMRLQKFLARAGVASRRKCEQLIADGRISVNGSKVCELGTKVNAELDSVTFDGIRVTLPDEGDKVVIALNKPAGYLSAMSDERTRTVAELIPVDKYKGLFPVGRLDFDTTGLLLFTNDGELGHALLHPSRGVTKRYVATVEGDLSDSDVSQLESGIKLDDGMTAPAKCKILKSSTNGKSSVALEIHEGKKRQVRRMFKYLGHNVLTLKRTDFGPISLANLEVGHYRLLDKPEVLSLYAACGLNFE